MNKHPNLFLIGAPKSGTTSLAAELAQHPCIFLPKIKEPRFYDARVFYDFEEDRKKFTFEKYIDLYFHAPETSRWLLDGSVFIFYSIDAIKEILRRSPKAKFLLVLRDPVSASKSMHAQRLKTVYENLREVDDDFYNCFEKLEERNKGLGFPQKCRNRILFRYDVLYKYECVLPAVKTLLNDQLLILRYEDYLACPDKTHKRIFEFLGLDPGFRVERQKLNASVVVRKTKLSIAIYNIASWLRSYRENLQPLYSLILPVAERLLEKRNAKEASDPEGDARVREVFSDTYRFLEDLKTDR